MTWKTKAIILITIILLTACSGTTPSPTAQVLPTVTRIPPTLFPTALTQLTSTSVFIPTFTPTSVSRSIYYMIVVDASTRMTESFDGQTRWDAARESAQAIIDGLEPGANYGLVVMGGSTPSDGTDSCNQPSVVRVPFSARSVVNSQVSQLQPIGAGSTYSAFFLARRQFESLPDETTRALIMITSLSDDCQSQNEWRGLEDLSKVLDEVGLEFHSEIIVLDENENPELKSTADRIGIWSKGKVGFQFPQNFSMLQEAQAAVIGNVTTYIENIIATRPTATLDAFATFTPESSLPTNTLGASSYTLTAIPGLQTNTPGASSFTFTPRPGTATFTPTITLTPTPRTLTPTLTPTITRTPTPTQAPTVELISFNYRTTGIGCQVDIVVKVSGSPATGSFHIMNSSNTPVGEVFQEITLPVGIYGNNTVSLNGNRPETYVHEVWFEFGDLQSNRLTNLKCLFLPTPTP